MKLEEAFSVYYLELVAIMMAKITNNIGNRSWNTRFNILF